MNIALNTIPEIQRFKPSETIFSKANVRPPSKANAIRALASLIEYHGQLQARQTLALGSLPASMIKAYKRY